MAIEQLKVVVLPDGRMDRANAAIYLDRKSATLATWASKGFGPRPIRVNGRVYYEKDDLDAFKAGASVVG